MTLFASTSSLSPAEDLLTRVEDMRSAGLTAIELSQSIHVPGDSDRWIPALRATGCRFLVHNYFPPPAEPFVLNLASPDEGVMRRSLELVRTAIRLSAELGAPFYSVHAGFVSDPYAFGTTHFLFHQNEGRNAREYAMERFRLAIRGALEDAARAGIELLVENNNAPDEYRDVVLLRDPLEIDTFIRGFGSSELGLLLDTGHLHVASRVLGFDGEEAANVLRPHIRAFHLHDNDGSADYHQKATRNGWALTHLAEPLRAAPAIVAEAQVADCAELREHLDSLSTLLELRGND